MVELARRDPHVTAVELSRNHGHQLALTAGLSLCAGERVLIIDDDLQDPPELLGAMMRMMDEGADVVYGQRNSRAGEGWAKRTSASLFYRLLRALTDIEIPVDAGEFRLMSRRALQAFLAMPERHRFVCGMVSWVGFKQVPVRYDRAERFAGASSYRLRDMVRLAIDAITGFSMRPLRLANYLCLLLALAALLTLGYAISQWLVGSTVPGWTSVMAVVLLLGSIQMMVLAVMCEYLGRLFMEAKHRPLFLIDRIVRSDQVISAEQLLPQAEPPVWATVTNSTRWTGTDGDGDAVSSRAAAPGRAAGARARARPGAKASGSAGRLPKAPAAGRA
jgi:dolichol-phosphate mannosyltransferase